MDVLIVDDTPTKVTPMQALVAGIDGRRPRSFTESAARLQWCLDNDPDLVIVDYMVPAPDGIELIRRIRESPAAANTPLLMVSAAHERQVRPYGPGVGCHRFSHQARRSNRVHLPREEHARAAPLPTAADGPRGDARGRGAQYHCHHLRPGKRKPS